MVGWMDRSIDRWMYGSMDELLHYFPSLFSLLSNSIFPLLVYITVDEAILPKGTFFLQLKTMTKKMLSLTRDLVIFTLLQAVTITRAEISYDSRSKSYRHVDDGALTSVPDDIPDEAKIVDLSRNAIIACPSFPSLSAVSTIRFKYNFMTAFPNLTSVSTSLTYVDLESNRISSVSEELLSALTNLEVVLLSYNELSSLPDVAMPKLRSLGLTGNLPMKNLPELPKLGRTVKSLNIGHPAMDDISVTSLRSMPKLVYLNMDGGGQNTTPPVTEANPLLEQLLIPHNVIRTLPEDLFLRLRNLRIVCVSDNLLETFPDPCHANYWMVTLQ